MAKARYFWLWLACALAGACAGGVAAATDAGNALDVGGCPEPAPASTPGLCPQWKCDAADGLWVHAEVECEDGDLCAYSSCSEGTCIWRWQTDCSDGHPCTPDTCDPKKGCVPDTPKSAGCDDHDVCTTDTCDPTLGCRHVDIGYELCKSDDPCTLGLCKPSTGCYLAQSGKCPATSSCSPSACYDANPCTNDFCDGSQNCAHTDATGSCYPMSNPCKLAATCGLGTCNVSIPTCDDGDACTNDRYIMGACGCSHVPLPGCTPSCKVDLDCQDSNAATMDLCVQGECMHSILPGECATDASCDDGKVCTADICTQITGWPTGLCQHEAIPKCCVSAAYECLPEGVYSLQCALPTCIDHVCGQVPLDDPTCCHSDADCGHDSCSPVLCEKAMGIGSTPGMYVCVYNDDSSCECGMAGETCDDNNCASQDYCVYDLNACHHFFPPPACKSDSGCDDKNPCTTDVCGQNPACGQLAECLHEAVAGCK